MSAEIERLRLQTKGRQIQVLVGSEDVVLRMKNAWGDDSRGIAFHDIVVDARELARSASAARENQGATVRSGIFTCGCGVVGCTGIDAVEVTHDGYEVHWRIPPSSEESAPLEFTFDPPQYFKEIERMARTLPRGPTKADRDAAKKAKRKHRR